MHVSPRFSRSGFSLVELLVVIAIMSILLTMGAAALRGAGGQGTATALASTEALFDEARSLAIGKGTRSRVLVDVDDPDSDYYLRRVAVAYEELNEEGEPIDGSWVLSARGYTMPEGTYFSREYSDGESGGLETESLDLAGGGYDGQWVIYEFNSEGICTTGIGGNNYQPPSFVVGAGARAIGDNEPRTTPEARRDFKGFVIWRNGATSVFRDPGQIIGEGEPQNF